MSKDCVACLKACEKGYLLVKDNAYHPECFRCATCKLDLAGKPYLDNETSIFCENCYYDQFNPFCGHCDEKIKGPYIEALDKCWHEHHFVCSSCGEAFAGDSFHKHENRPYCEQHYLELVADTCGTCKKPIIGDMFEADDNKYHPECFVCSAGKHKIQEGDKFHVYDRKLYCTEHLADMLRLSCAVCNKSIMGEYVKVNDNKLHKQCWTCTRCKKVLSANDCDVKNGDFFCRSCALLQTERNPSAQSSSGPPSAGGSRPVVQEWYTFDMLKDAAFLKEKGIPYVEREMFLADDEFTKLFGMDKERFTKLPKWKQKQKKQQVGLF